MYSIPPGSTAVTLEPYSPSRTGTCASKSVVVATVLSQFPTSRVASFGANSRGLTTGCPAVVLDFLRARSRDQQRSAPPIGGPGVNCHRGQQDREAARRRGGPAIQCDRRS